jgi:redox-sensitive bicupin YhaK (pirin superfamily)
MITLRPATTIHAVDGGWFSARWHFSFDHYRDPAWMGVGPLRVFNDDRLVPGAIWPLHPHRDIEGITYVVEGTFRHEDSIGNGGVLLPGAVQRATLGRGMWHSEQNGSGEQPLRFLQFWILPDTADLEPSVEQRQLTQDDRTNRLLRVLGPEGGAVVKVHQDASVHVARLEPGVRVEHPLSAGRAAYAYLIDGRATLNGHQLATGDAAVVTDEPVALTGGPVTAELILVDVPLRWTPVGVWAG